jgi:hypothetical protein
VEKKNVQFEECAKNNIIINKRKVSLVVLPAQKLHVRRMRREMVVETVNSSLRDLLAGSLATCVNHLVAFAGIVDVATLERVDPSIREGILDGDALGRIQVKHPIHKLHGGGLQSEEDRVSGVGTIPSHFTGRIALLPLLKAFDVALEVDILAVEFGGVPERAGEDDDEIDHGTRPHIKFPGIVGA